MMTRKHFLAIADVLYTTGASWATCVAIAEVLAADNPAFDRERFMTAAFKEPVEPETRPQYVELGHEFEYCFHCGAPANECKCSGGY
jgi:hypothetical protein